MIKENQRALNQINGLTDALILFPCMAFAYFIRFDLFHGIPGHVGLSYYMTTILCMAPLFWLMYGLMGLYDSFRSKNFLREFSLLLRSNVILFGVLLGRFICGFLCPFGWFQELLHKIPTKKLSTKRLKPLTYLKYVILVVMVFLLPVLVVNETGMGDPFFCKYLCPQGVLEGAIPLSLVNSSIRAALGKLFSWKLCVLITVVVLSVIFYRPFCKWLCPLGAFYALFNRVSLLSMHVDESKCVSCGKCARTCPMDVDVTKTPNHSECIRCGKCVTACPTEAVRFRYAFGSGGACSKLSQKPIIEENKGE